jgi:hypothetical protein
MNPQEAFRGRRADRPSMPGCSGAPAGSREPADGAISGLPARHLKGRPSPSMPAPRTRRSSSVCSPQIALPFVQRTVDYQCRESNRLLTPRHPGPEARGSWQAPAVSLTVARLGDPMGAWRSYRLMRLLVS